jgi:hypothetical protein
MGHNFYIIYISFIKQRILCCVFVYALLATRFWLLRPDFRFFPLITVKVIPTYMLSNSVSSSPMHVHNSDHIFKANCKGNLMLLRLLYERSICWLLCTKSVLLKKGLKVWLKILPPIRMRL